MSSLASNPTSGRTHTALTSNIWFLLNAALGGLTLIALATYFILALNWYQLPFIGALVTRNMVVDGALPFEQVSWPALEAGLQRLDQIIAINDQPLAANPQDYDAAHNAYRRILSGFQPGDLLTLTFDRPGGLPCPDGTASPCQITIKLSSFDFVPFVGFFFAPFITAVISLVIGLAVLWLRPRQTDARLVSMTTLLLALALAGLFDLNTTHALIPLWVISTIMVGTLLGHLALVFPQKSLWIFRHPYIIYVPYIVGGLYTALMLWTYIAPPSPQYQIGSPTFLYIFLGMIVFLISAIRHRHNANSAIIRDQSNAIIIGLVLTFAPLILWIINLIAQFVNARALVPFNTSAAAPFAVLAPVSLAYAVLQYRKIDTDRAISQGITYTIMLAALIVGYFLLVFGTTLIFAQFNLFANNPLFLATTVFVIAVGFLPVRNALQERIDKIYFRTRQNYQSHNRRFMQEVAEADHIDAVIRAFRHTLAETIGPSSVFVFLPGVAGGDFLPIGDAETKTDITFSADTGIINALEANDHLIYLEAGRPWPLEIRGEKPRLEILRALLILGLRGSKQFNGFICVGPPKSGSGVYDYEQLHFIQSLVNQMAVATDRAQIVDSLERRVQQLEALRQVSQAANFLIQFDELLELLNAQTNRLIDAGYFYIALRDDKTDELYYGFFQEAWERFSDKENLRWKPGSDLISEIARRSQPVRVANYAAAMAERGAEIVFETPNLKAWMGMPLIAGPRVVGVMAVGTTRANTAYTEEQFKFFGDISELAATSIDKARLFEETQKRARQLAALNDISHRLAGELEDIDKLLQIITQSAVNIIGVEAGSLLLTVDDNNKKLLEFKIAVGPVGQELIGTRFPIGKGLAGKVATTGQPVMVNDASTDPDWGGEQAGSNGFHTRSILAVPLIANNQTLGVLEVVNKRDGTPYDQEDSELLTTFAGQAAVAINNAQLFQMTDQQLSARLEELEILERIDGELNRALDARKVAEITVRWAISQSGATAGLLGLVVGDPPVLHVITRYGYTEEDYPEGVEGDIWPLDKGIVSRVLRTRQPDTQSDVRLDPNYVASLRFSLSQMTIPMLSGGDVIAMLVLETNREPRLGLAQQFFVQRLAEHASVALANAQLYAELERSNNSKSEFVSFVAHELKNPMTSIKGYTELMLMGARMGKLDEQQSDWLNRIKSNIERMNTLVSDLNDVTKIQTNNLRMEFSPLPFQDVIAATLMPIQRQVEEKQQSLVISAGPNGEMIYGDKNRLIQVLTNMVSNAHKYTPEGGTIEIISEVVDNRWDPKGRDTRPVMHIQVKDDGIGMSEEDLNQLFKPYFRSENPLAQEQPGTGLGLTITRGIIEGHGGQVWVESELGAGTSFHFTLPIATQDQMEQTEA